MSRHVSTLNRLEVTAPCTADWDSMTGNEQVRFCGHCRKSVHNLSEMTVRQALELVAASGGQLCVRYNRGQDGSIKSNAPTPFHQIIRRATRLAAGAFTAALALSSSVAAQSSSSNNSPLAPTAAATPISEQNPTPENPGSQRQIVELQINGQTAESNEFVTTMGMVAISPSDPMLIAVMRDDLAAVEALIAAGVEVNSTDKGLGTTPLAQAVENNNQEIIETLLRAGADINRTNRNGMTPLMFIGENTTAELVRELIAVGARVNHRDEDGETALMYAARTDNVKVLRELLNAGAKVNAKSNNRQTALMFAAEQGLVENVRALINAQADINRRDKDGATALKLARDGEHEDVIELLVAFGAIEENDAAQP